MAIADSSTTTARVKRQYELYPYPPRNPAEEATRPARTRLDQLDQLNHYCFEGKRDFRHGFRVLVAGGGTGDSTIFLAQQLADTDARIVHLDLSEPAIDIARRRARQHGLAERISWVCASLLDLPNSGLGPFDYINCTGVLHHLDDPAAGLAALVSVLEDDGALGLLLYACYGRVGIYQMQDLMGLINHDEQRPQVMIDNTKQMLACLPPTNWLKRSPGMLDKAIDPDDAETYDLYLHAKDQAFTVLQLYRLLDGCNLHLVEFCREMRALYDPRFVLRSPGLSRQVQKLPLRYQQAVAEIFWGNIDNHVFWASPRTATVASPRDPDNVPIFSRLAQSEGVPDSLLTAADTAGCRVWHPSLEGESSSMVITLKLHLNDVNRQLIRLIDGRRTMGQIVRRIVADGGTSHSVDEVWQLCCEGLESLRMFDFVLLRHASVPHTATAAEI